MIRTLCLATTLLLCSFALNPSVASESARNSSIQSVETMHNVYVPSSFFEKVGNGKPCKYIGKIKTVIKKNKNRVFYCDESNTWNRLFKGDSLVGKVCRNEKKKGTISRLDFDRATRLLCKKSLELNKRIWTLESVSEGQICDEAQSQNRRLVGDKELICIQFTYEESNDVYIWQKVSGITTYQIDLLLKEYGFMPESEVYSELYSKANVTGKKQWESYQAYVRQVAIDEYTFFGDLLEQNVSYQTLHKQLSKEIGILRNIYTEDTYLMTPFVYELEISDETYSLPHLKTLVDAQQDDFYEFNELFLKYDLTDFTRGQRYYFFDKYKTETEEGFRVAENYLRSLAVKKYPFAAGKLNPETSILDLFEPWIAIISLELEIPYEDINWKEDPILKRIGQQTQEVTVSMVLEWIRKDGRWRVTQPGREYYSAKPNRVLCEAGIRQC